MLQFEYSIKVFVLYFSIVLWCLVFFLVSLFYGMVSIVWMLVCLFECICVYIYGWCGYGVVFLGPFILLLSVIIYFRA